MLSGRQDKLNSRRKRNRESEKEIEEKTIDPFPDRRDAAAGKRS
jgi:hypothetical protein